MVQSAPNLYPRELQEIFGPSRSYDASYRMSILETAPRVPPTTLQISVLDIEPAVWAEAFVPKTPTPRRKPTQNQNTGEFSREEIEKMTEAAIKRNEERNFEKEERRLKLKEARENRIAGVVTPVQTPVRKTMGRKRKLPVPPPSPEKRPASPSTSRGPLQKFKRSNSRAGSRSNSPSKLIGPKSVIEQIRKNSPGRSPTSRSPARSRPPSPAAATVQPIVKPIALQDKTLIERSRRRRPGRKPQVVEEPVTEKTPQPDSLDLSYDAQVLSSVSEELVHCFEMSPVKRTKISEILLPKVI
jgi:hypothetical protein